MRKWAVRRDEFKRWVAIQPDGTRWVVGPNQWPRAHAFAYDHATSAITEIP